MSKAFDVSQYLSDFSANFVSEMTNYWDTILYGLGAALAFMIIYLILLKFLIGVLIWTCIAGIIGGCGYLAYYFLN